LISSFQIPKPLFLLYFFFVPIASLAAFFIAIFMFSHALSIVQARGYSLRFLASLCWYNLALMHCVYDTQPFNFAYLSIFRTPVQERLTVAGDTLWSLHSTLYVRHNTKNIQKIEHISQL
jgi:hypothetical protein